MSNETQAIYGHLCDYNTGDIIREATAVEAEESSTQSGDEGVIVVDGRDCYVDGPVVVAGQIVQRDLSGVGHNWETMYGTMSPEVAEELAGEILDDSTGRTKVVASGKARIGGVWYRWGH
jgi:nicotinamide mononucleotide (NMN) deamidase PncC